MANAPTIPPLTEAGFSEDGDAYVERARSLRDLLRAEAPEGEKLRTPTAKVSQALNDNKLLTLLLPRRWGGAGLSFTDFARVQFEMGKGDPSVSWVVQIIGGTTWISSLASDETQEALFGEGPKLVCGAYNPPGTARKVDGGFIVNGSWPYTSGSRESYWAQTGVVLSDTGGPVVPGVVAYVPFSQLEMKDTWYMSGMQGTGSDTSVAKEVFVPNERMVMPDNPYGLYTPGKKHVGAPSDRLPIVPSVRATGLAQLIGAAEAMLELLEGEPNKPIVTTTYKARIESSVFLHDVGEVAAQIDAAKVLLFNATALLDNIGLSGRPFTDAEKAKHKAQCGQIVQLVHTAIESIMFLAGSSAFALDKPICRFWRDIHVGLRHITNIPMLSYEIYGRNRAGVQNISPSGAF